MGNNFFVLKQIGNKAHLNIEVVKYAQNFSIFTLSAKKTVSFFRDGGGGIMRCSADRGD